MYDRIHNFFAFCFVPLCCWQVWIFPAVPNYYLQHALFYPCVLLLACAWGSGAWRMAEACRRWMWLLPWLALVLAVQAVALWRSAPLCAPDVPAARAVAGGLLKLLVQVPFLVFFAEIVRLLLRREHSRRAFLYGALVAFAALVAWCVVQGLAVLTQQADLPAARLLHTFCAEIVRVCSPWVEARWVATAISMYAAGSYALTEGRINGFFEEASILAMWVSVFFVPLGMGLYAAGRQDGGKVWRQTGAAVLCAALLLLLLGRSSTGVALGAAAVLTACLLLWRRALCRCGWKGWCGALLVLALAAGICTGLTGGNWHLLSGKDNRWTVTQVSAEMTAEYPLTGVGRGAFTPHFLRLRPLVPEDVGEMRAWKTTLHSIPPLCTLLAATAEYGLPLVLLLAWGCVRLWLRLRRQFYACPDAGSAFWYVGGTAYFVLAFVALWASLDVRNPFFLCAFVCAVYGGGRQGLPLSGLAEGEIAEHQQHCEYSVK